MKKKILTGLGIIVLLLLLGTISSQARIVTNDPTVESGGTVTINVTSQEVVYGYKISISSNSGLTFNSVSGGESNGSTVSNVSLSGTQSLATYTFKAPEVTQDTTYTVTFLGDGIILNPEVDEKTSSSATATVTVKAKQTSTSTGGGSTTGNNDTQTQTPSNTTNTGNTNASSNTNTSNEPTFTETNQTVYVHNTESVNVRSGPGTSYSSLGRLAKNTAVTRTGVGSNGWSRVSYNGQTAYISSSYLTTTKPEEEAKSSNAMLSGLTVDVEGLSPEFNKDTDNYTLQVGSGVEAIQITATPEDENATVQVQGNENLQEGENTVTITVTAEDGTTKVYTITVNKGNVEQVASLGLNTLTIAGIDMEEVFSPTTYEYTIEINEDVTQLDITAEANEEGATVEIVGNQDFQEGENIVSIIVKSANGEETVTYQLTINKNTAAVAENSNQTQNLIFICLFVGIVVVIIIVVSILLYKRHKKKIEEEYDFGNGEEDNQFYNDNFENTIEGQDEQEDTVYQNTIQQGYTDVVEDEEELEEKPKRKKGKHF